jgi:hypothetical protein
VYSSRARLYKFSFILSVIWEEQIWRENAGMGRDGGAQRGKKIHD